MEEIRLEGVAVAPGLARGEAVVHWIETEEVPYRKITRDEVPGEIGRFEQALMATRAELLSLQHKIAQAIGTDDASIFDAHLLVVEDRTLIDEVLRNVETELHNIETAFDQVAERYCRTLSQIDDAYLRERVGDIEDVSRRIIGHLLGRSGASIHDRTSPHIVIAHNLTPSDTALINRDHILGFATEAGSKTSHTAIMARSLGIPAVVGIKSICEEVSTGDCVLLDGYRGIVILNPSPETLAEYETYEEEKDRVEETLELIRETSSTTHDGTHIVLSANIELPDEVDDVDGSGAEGVGLFRTEFLFLNREHAPDEDEQFESYRKVAEACNGQSVIIRTLDIGGDKSFGAVDYPDEENPFLGCRAIRFCLKNPDIFKPQLRAILRASKHGNVKLMYPMVSGLTELRQANAVLEECKAELQAEGAEFNEALEVGIMIEVPSAALSADLLASEVSFFSIGTNDLIQYTIAVDRVNDQIAHLYKPTHPSILRLIQMVVKAAHDKGIWAGVCGEMAGDVVLTPLLLGLGVDELSTAPAIVPRVKKAVQSLDIETCRAMAGRSLGMSSASEIWDLCMSTANEFYPELLS